MALSGSHQLSATTGACPSTDTTRGKASETCQVRSCPRAISLFLSYDYNAVALFITSLRKRESNNWIFHARPEKYRQTFAEPRYPLSSSSLPRPWHPSRSAAPQNFNCADLSLFSSSFLRAALSILITPVLLDRPLKCYGGTIKCH